MSYLVVALAALVAGCAAGRPVCTPREQPAVNDLLYFGTAIPGGGGVTTQEWDEFLRSIVTPLFPAGLSSWAAAGQWRGADGRVVREDSHVLQLLHPADDASEESIRRIIAEYERRFEQEAVLRVRADACTSL